MAARNWITKNLFLPMGDLALGRSISKQIKFLDKSQWWSPEEIKEYQNEKLRQIIKYAYENVPYYNELFDELKLSVGDIKTSADLVKLPILTKEIIRKNFPHKIVSKNFPKSQRMFGASSGSTGEPLQYYSCKGAYSFNIACALRGWLWAGCQVGDKYVKISQNPRSGVVNKIQDWAHNCIYIHSQSLTIKNIADITAKVRKAGAKLVRGYPSTLYVLAEHMKQNNITDIRPAAITTTGEILFPYMRELIEQQFGCKVFDAYSGEGGANVSQCPMYEAYHVSAEYAITELVSDGKVIEGPGTGDVVSTDLWNYAMPFIRYNVKDMAVRKDSSGCSCGRGLPVLAEIKGRDADIIVTPSGKRLIVHFFTGYFEYVETVKQFQVEQTKADEIILKLIPNEKFDSDSQEKIKTDMTTYIGRDVNLVIKIVEEIPLARSGKRRFIIAHVGG